MNKTDLRSIIAKLHEIEQGPAEPVNEAAIPKLFNFFKGLGAGGSKAVPKPRIEPVGPGGIARGADEVVSAAVQNADTKLSKIRKITPAEAAAAKAEGITIDEMLMRKFPDTFAKLEKNPELKTKVATEFSKSADEIMVAIERGENPRAFWPKEEGMYDRKSLAMSVMGHTLLGLGLLITNKNTGSSSSSDNNIPADEIPWTTYLGMDPRQGDYLIRGHHAGLATWKVISPGGVAVARINGPNIVNKIEKLAAMTPEERKKLAQAEPKDFQVDLYSTAPTGAQQPTVKELPKAPAAGTPAPTSAPDKEPDIVISKKKPKTKEQEEAEKKKREAAEAAKKAEEDKKRKVLPTLTF